MIFFLKILTPLAFYAAMAVSAQTADLKDNDVFIFGGEGDLLGTKVVVMHGDHCKQQEVYVQFSNDKSNQCVDKEYLLVERKKHSSPWRNEENLFFIEGSSVEIVNNIASNSRFLLFKAGEKKRVVDLNKLNENNGFMVKDPHREDLIATTFEESTFKTGVIKAFNDVDSKDHYLSGAVVEDFSSHSYSRFTLEKVLSAIRMSSKFIVTGTHAEEKSAKEIALSKCQEGASQTDESKGVHQSRASDGSSFSLYKYQAVCMSKDFIMEEKEGPLTKILKSGEREFFSAGAMNPAYGREEFCKKKEDPEYFQKLLYDFKNRISIFGENGYFNFGLCWWTTMFQRNATYLTVFRPDLAKPDEEEATKLIREIVSKKGVVEIPGFRNLNDFSVHYEKIIVGFLSRWQLSDGLLAGGFFRGLGVHISALAKDYQSEEEMDEIYREVNGKKRLTFVSLPIQGVGVHSWLIFNMAKTDSGYVFDLLDSLTLSITRRHYTKGQKGFLFDYHKGKLKTTQINVGRKWLDHSAYEEAIKNYCEKGIKSKDLRLN